MHTLIGVSLVSLLLSAGPGVPPTGPITPDETDQVHEWPAVKQGVWSIEGTLKPKKGRRSVKVLEVRPHRLRL